MTDSKDVLLTELFSTIAVSDSRAVSCLKSHFILEFFLMKYTVPRHHRVAKLRLSILVFIDFKLVRVQNLPGEEEISKSIENEEEPDTSAHY